MTIKVTYNVTDVYMSQSVSPVYINVSYSDGGASGGGVWGSITGTLSNQTDLQTALDLKLDESTIDGGTEGQILSKASATDFDFAWINNYAKYLATNVRNQTGSTIGAFQVVYISGATGNKPLVSLADADTEATSSKTYGVTATEIANNGTGDVVTAGELTGINTSAFNEGDLLWLSTTAGGVVTTPPAEPAHAVFIGYVVRSHPTLGVIDVSIQNGYELNELHGVQITTPTDNQGLFYNATSTLWENKSISTVLGYTPEQPLTFNSPLSRAGNVVSIPQATGSVNGFLSATDWTTFNNKQTALGYTPVPTTRNITINGVTYDLSADRTWTISTGISGSGASGQVTYWTGASAVSGSNNLFWDNANGRLGIGTNTPAGNFEIVGTSAANSFATIYSDNTVGAGFFGRKARGTIAIPTSPLSGDNILGFGGTGYANGQFQPAKAGIFFDASENWTSTGNGTQIRFATTANGGTTRSDKLQIFNNGNVLIQNGGTFSDGGQRLQVIGDTLLRGSGATSATTALTVQNSASTNLFTVRNDGNVGIGTASPLKQLHIASSTGAEFYFQDTSAVASINITTLSNTAGNFAIVTRSSTGAYVFDNWGIVINSTTSSYQRWFTSGSERMRLKTSGQLRFLPLASAPSGAEAGDVYYNSTDNKHYGYNGTTWNAFY